MARGRKTADRSGWMRPGGSLPPKPSGLNKAELAHYRWILAAIKPLGIGGKSDLMSVTLAARIAARADRLRAELEALPQSTVVNSAGGIVMHPLFAELGRTESRLRDCLCGLYLSPRTRGSTRLPGETQAEAQGGAAADSQDSKFLSLLA